MALPLVLAVVLALVCAIILLRSVQVVPQRHVRIIERLGVQRRTLPAGLHLLVPVVDAPIGTYAESSIRSVRINVDGRTSDQRPTRCAATVRCAVDGTSSGASELADVAARTVRDSLARASSSDLRANTDDELERHLRSQLDDAMEPLGVRVIDVRLSSIQRP